MQNLKKFINIKYVNFVRKRVLQLPKNSSTNNLKMKKMQNNSNRNYNEAEINLKQEFDNFIETRPNKDYLKMRLAKFDEMCKIKMVIKYYRSNS
jgi:hypothetical protein